MKVDQRRVKTVNNMEYNSGPILYWMSREMRVHDNWALLYAQEQARKHDVPFAVVYNLKTVYLDGGERQFRWKVESLREIDETCAKKRIPFVVLHGDNAEQDIVRLVKKHNVGMLVTDFCPLRLNRKWIAAVKRDITVPFVEVDAHNIVPVWEASPKLEFAAYTIRKKIHSRLEGFLTEFPRVQAQKKRWPKAFPTHSWKNIESTANFKHDVPPVDWLIPGEKAAKRNVRTFLEKRFTQYSESRNDPTENALSNISPWLHYGNISPQTVALKTLEMTPSSNDQESFLEELIVRRELSDNFCYYNKQYDSFDGLPDWAKETLNKHRGDKREYEYTLKQFEKGETHSALWNAAQMEMVRKGKMHGYMRMFWAKKILEWTPDPETALRIAITLNDRYELDGRDPNGYVGVMWSVGGVHDRAWTERPVYGKIRYMNENGCRRKFDVDKYIQQQSQDSFL